MWISLVRGLMENQSPKTDAAPEQKEMSESIRRRLIHQLKNKPPPPTEPVKSEETGYLTMIEYLALLRERYLRLSRAAQPAGPP